VSQIECPCGAVVKIADSYRRHPDGRKRVRSVCKDCHERSVRQGSKLIELKGGRKTSDLRR
jgi:hypothetical protein